MTGINYGELLRIAKKAAENAYAPYSKTANGAALLARDGRVFTGCTLEIANYASSVCAGKAALIKAVSEGARDFVAIAVAGPGVDLSYLCGDCRQSFAEFAPDLLVISEANPSRVQALRELLPHAFLKEDLLER